MNILEPGEIKSKNKNANLGEIFNNNNKKKHNIIYEQKRLR